MNTQVKYLAAAVAALGSVAAYAAPLDPTTTTPTVTVYVAGASAQATPIQNIMPSTVFATPADVVHIVGNAISGVAGVPNDILGLANTAVKSEAWLGMSIASLTGNVSVPTLVIYNNTNGSAAGLNQLVATYSGAEAYNVVLPCAAATASGTFTAPDGLSTLSNYTCNTMAPLAPANMALSDVAPTEFAAGIVPTGATLKVSKTGLEGFGIMVNPRLYTDLQTQNIHDGLLPSTCAGDATLSCQPSIRSADYATLANHNNASSNTYATLLPNAGPAGDGTLTLCRRDNYSGSQATSNILFLNSVCGTKGYFGSLPAASQLSGDSTASFLVVDNSTGGKVTSCIDNAAGYGLGFASTSTGEAANHHFVKIDGVSPNAYTPSGGVATADPKNRVNMIRGDYKFAVDMTASVRSTASTTTSAIKIANALIADLQKVTKSNLSGIGYLPGTGGGSYGDGQTAHYIHGGNNCAPLH